MPVLKVSRPGCYPGRTKIARTMQAAVPRTMLDTALRRQCPERKMAREVCAYGERLSDTFKFASDPPFEKTYADYKILLDVLDGENSKRASNTSATRSSPRPPRGARSRPRCM